MANSELMIEEVSDAGEIERLQVQQQRARANRKWLDAHWDALLPEAKGKFVAVAGQQAFVADTPERAWELAEAAYPDDDGALVQYVQTLEGPRFFENRG